MIIDDSMILKNEVQFLETNQEKLPAFSKVNMAADVSVIDRWHRADHRWQP